jgi:hypothetical protein
MFLKGTLTLLNTKESFKLVDKNAFISNDHDNDESDIKVLCYLDLKTHTAIYWVAFPTLPGIVADNYDIIPHSYGATVPAPVDPARLLALDSLYTARRISNYGGRNPLYFVVNDSLTSLYALDDFVEMLENGGGGGGSMVDGVTASDEYTYCYVASSEADDCKSWILRNLLSRLHRLYYRLHNDESGGGGDDARIAVSEIKIMSYSPILRRLDLSPDGNSFVEPTQFDVEDASSSSSSSLSKANVFTVDVPQWLTTEPPSVRNSNDLRQPQRQPTKVGWELNAQNRPGPRIIKYSTQTSDIDLANQSADLNLQLMRWRVIPDLETPLLKNTSVLLLGSGTLGCAVARTLIGWGVRKITFVDSGKVSFSNPVRQSLFEFNDCLNGGRWKAEAAADACKRILPSMDVSGVVLSIPMPGHAVSSHKEKEDTEMLEKLIKEHNVTYLLTDTRESRWLPTVIAAAENKPMINIALGLGSWVVVRHGRTPSSAIPDAAPPPPAAAAAAPPPPTAAAPSGDDVDVEARYQAALNLDGNRLGCYFCSDVVAPANSMADRTLDQQCTVTRPGLAPIASSMGVELMVGMVHRKGPGEEQKGALGEVPGVVRGELAEWRMMTSNPTAFSCCTACSDVAVNEWRKSKFGFVEKVCGDDGTWLEELVGLTKLKQDAEDVDWDVDGEEDDMDDF